MAVLHNCEFVLRDDDNKPTKRRPIVLPFLPQAKMCLFVNDVHAVAFSVAYDVNREAWQIDVEEFSSAFIEDESECIRFFFDTELLEAG